MSTTKAYWPLVLDDLKGKISGSQYKAWFSKLHFVSTANRGRKIILSIHSQFSREYIESKFKDQLKDSVTKYYPQVIHIDFEIQKNTEEREENQQRQEVLVQENEEEKGDRETAASKPSPRFTNNLPANKNLNNLNPKYTFDNFVVTTNNELAVSVAKAIIRQPGTLYNPVFLYSAVGLGKTHLLQAIGQKFLEEYPSYNIKYVTCETFFNHYMASFQKNKSGDFNFHEYYRSVDLLLLDDIQFIAGKDGTQEAFFNTFNELHQQNKQIIITSDKPPEALKSVEERLVSRFKWGMTVDISQPDLEARLAIIKDKASRLLLPLLPEQILQIGEKVTSNVRDMEGVLNQLQARSKLRPGQPVSQNDLDKVLNSRSKTDLASSSNSNSLPLSDQILLLVAKLWQVSPQDIVGAGRQKNLSIARQVVMYLYQNHLKISLPVIGQMLGGRDHTTVLYGAQKIQEQLKNDEILQRKLEQIQKDLRH